MRSPLHRRRASREPLCWRSRIPAISLRPLCPPRPSPHGCVEGLASGRWFWSSPPAPVYPSFGPRLRNEVKYIGDFRGGRLTRYTSGMRFVSGLRASGADLLIVGLGDPPVRHVPEQDWAQAAGYSVVTRSRWFALYKNPKAVLRRRPADPR